MKYLVHALLGVAFLVSAVIVGVTGIQVDQTVTTESPMPVPPDPFPPNPGPQPNPGPNPYPPNPYPPNPNPVPPTPPPPDPGPVDGEFGIARLAWESAKRVNRPDECRALAGAFRELANYVRTNNPGLMTIIGIPGVREGLLQQYLGRAIPPASRPAWSQFGEVIKGAIKAAYDAEKLQDSSGWAKCFDEIATGLEAVR